MQVQGLECKTNSLKSHLDFLILVHSGINLINLPTCRPLVKIRLIKKHSCRQAKRLTNIYMLKIIATLSWDGEFLRCSPCNQLQK